MRNQKAARRILSDNEYSCSICGLKTWQNAPITLEADHINGDESDNRVENLRWLCPNCHSQTSTFRGRNIKKHVPDEELERALISSQNIRQALMSVGLVPKGANYARAKLLVQRLGKKLADGVLYTDGRSQLRPHRHKVKHPTENELKQLICEYDHNLTAIGRLFGVSDNAVRKWCKQLGILPS